MQNTVSLHFCSLSQPQVELTLSKSRAMNAGVGLCAVADSWLTVDETDGGQDGDFGNVKSVGIDFSQWSETKGLDVSNGAVLVADASKAPGVKKFNDDPETIVIAQLTVKEGASFDGQVNAHGQNTKDASQKSWAVHGIHFHGGPELYGKAKKCSDISDCPACHSSLDVKCGAGGVCACQAKHGAGGTNSNSGGTPPPPPDVGSATGIVEVWAGDGSVNNGISGYTTYRLSLKLFGDAQNVYSIYGKSGSMMKFPAAKQVQPPLGTNVSLPQLSCLCCCLTTLTDCVFRAHLI